MNRTGLVCGILLAVLAARPVQAGELQPVKVTEQFPRWELVGIGTLAAANLSTLLGRSWYAGLRDEPAIGGPGSWDRAASDALFSGDLEKPYFGAADVLGGVVLVSAGSLFYASDAAIAAYRDGPGFSGDVYSNLHFFAFAEAYLVSTTLTQVAKFGVGRTRPMYELRRAPWDPDDDEAYLSFWSGHTASAFCVGSYVYRDLSDWLVSQKGKGVWVGRVLPAIGIYGLAGLVGVSRIADQKHYLSDVLVGAAVGTAVGQAVYAWHFDAAGNPRRLDGDGQRLELTAVPGGIGLRVVY